MFPTKQKEKLDKIDEQINNMCLEEGIRLKMKEFINKIKKFFKKFISRNKLKQIEAPKNSDFINDVTKLNIMKVDNRLAEKNRILELYNEIKNETIDLNEIDRDDLLKIRKLFLEEVKLQDEKLEDEIDILDMMKKVS